MTNLYQILGLQPNATQPQIRAAYLRLAGEHHPDRNVDDGSDREGIDREKFKQIVQAYEVLRDTEKKRRYDESIGIGNSTPFPGSSNGVVYQGVRPGAGLHRRDVPDGWVRGMGRSRRFQAWIWPLGFFLIGSILFFMFLHSLLKENDESHRSFGGERHQILAEASEHVTQSGNRVGSKVAELDLESLDDNKQDALIPEAERPRGSKPNVSSSLAPQRPDSRSKEESRARPSRGPRHLADELLKESQTGDVTPQNLGPLGADLSAVPTFLLDSFGVESLPPTFSGPNPLNPDVSPAEILPPNQVEILTVYSEPESEVHVELDDGGGGPPRRSLNRRERGLPEQPLLHGSGAYLLSPQATQQQRGDPSEFFNTRPSLPPELMGLEPPSVERSRSQTLLDEMGTFEKPDLPLPSDLSTFDSSAKSPFDNFIEGKRDEMSGGFSFPPPQKSSPVPHRRRALPDFPIPKYSPGKVTRGGARDFLPFRSPRRPAAGRTRF